MRTLASKLRIKNALAREFFAEFLGTFILVVLGDGAVAQMVVSNDNKMSTFLSVNFGFAMAVAFGVYVSGGVSGGHINPAVTLVMAVIGRLKWVKVPVYMIAQYLGAFCGAAVVFGVYNDQIHAFAKGDLLVSGDLQTAGIFATYPNPNVSTATALGDQVLRTLICPFLPSQLVCLLESTFLSPTFFSLCECFSHSMNVSSLCECFFLCVNVSFFV